MNRHKILIVDDEEKVREICRMALEYAGYQVGVSQNAQIALEFLEKEDDYALVLTDLNLPGLNGLELIREIEKRHPHCKTLLMTGSPSVNHTYTKDYLHKPFGFVELVSKIKKVLSFP